jgi:hypothetical protein
MKEDRPNSAWAPWLWLAWWLLVLGVLVVGLLQQFVWRLGPGQGPVGLLAAFALGVPSLFLWIRWLGERRRAEGFAAFCAKNKLRYEAVRPTGIPTEFCQLPVFHRGRPQSVRNWMAGKIKGLEVVVVDFAYTTRGTSAIGKRVKLGSHQTLFLVPEPDRDLPDFQLVPRVSALNKAVDEPADDFEELGFEELKWPEDEAGAFARNCRVGAEDVEAVAELFTPDVRELFASMKNWVVESRGGQLAIYQRDRRWGPAELPRFFERATAIVHVLVGAR